MNTYIVGYISFFENKLELYKIYSDSEINAAMHILKLKGGDSIKNMVFSDLESIKRQMFEWDGAINVIKI